MFLILFGKLLFYFWNFKKFQFLVIEKEQKRKFVIGVWYECWKMLNVLIFVVLIKYSENGRKFINDCGMFNNFVVVLGVL